MSPLSPNQHEIIYQEMMAHIPLFTHLKPHKVLIMGDNNEGILQEVLKHACVKKVWHISENTQSQNQDTRVIFKSSNDLSDIEPNSIDVLIIANNRPALVFDYYFNLLNKDGVLIQQISAAFNLPMLKATQQDLRKAGFSDVRILHFLQATQTPSWHSAVLAIKQGVLRRPREKDIFNRSFTTTYYNLDVHKAAFALPEFLRKELELEEVNG